MFELNGKPVSIETLQKAAKKYNMSYDEYLAKMKEKGLKEINPEPTFVQTTTEKEQQLLSDYNKSTKLTADQQAEIDSLNLDIFNDQEVITYDSTYGDITMPGANVRKPVKRYVKSKYYKYIDDQLEKAKEDGEEITKEEAKLRALEKIKTDKKIEFLGDNTDEYINKTFKRTVTTTGGLGFEDEFTEYNQETQQKYFKIAQKTEEDFQNYFKAQDEYLNNLSNDIDITVSELDELDKNIKNNIYESQLQQGDRYVIIDNAKVPLYIYEKYAKLYGKYQIQTENINNSIKKYAAFIEANKDQLEHNSIALDRLGRDYNYTKKNILNTAFGFGDIGIWLGKGTIEQSPTGKTIALSSKILKFILPKKIDIAKTAEAAVDIKWRNFKNEIMSGYAPDIKFSSRNKPGNYGRFVAQEISTQLPIFTFIAATGGAGAAAKLGVTANAAFTASAIALQSADKQYGDMTYEEYMSQLDDYKYNDIKYNEAHKLAVSAGFGLAEGVFGTIPSFYALRAANRVLRGAKPGIADNYLKGITKYYTQNAAVPMFAESFGEGLTQFTQNILTGRPAFEGVDHAAYSGLMFGVLLNGAPSVAGHMMNNFATPSQLAEVRKNNAKVKALVQQKMLLTDPKDIKAIDEQIMQLNEDSHQIIISVEKLIRDQMNPGDFQTVLDNKVQMEYLRQDAIDAKKEGKGQALIDIYQSLYDAKQTEIDVIIGLKGDIAKLKVQDPARYNALEQQAKQELLKNDITDSDSVFNKINELYIREEINKDYNNRKKINKQHKRKQIAPKPFETNQDLFNYLEKNNIPITDQQRQKIENGLVSGMNFEVGDVDYQVVSIENSIKNNKAGIVSHEGTHSDLKDMFGRLKDTAFKDLANEIMQWTKNNDPKLFNKLFVAGKQRVAQLNKDGDIITSFEEVVVGFLEQAGLDTYIQQPKSRTFFETITHGINRLKDKTYGTNSTNVKPKDAIEALIEFAKKLKSGEITLEDDIAKDVKKIIAKKKLIDTEQTTEQLENKNSEVYEGLTSAKKKEMSDIDNFVNMRNEDGTLVLQSNQDYSNNNEARIGVFNALNEPGNAYMGYFKNLVKADPSFANYTESELQTIAEDLRDKVYLDRIEKNYNPNVLGDGTTFNSLFSFIYGDKNGRGGRAVNVFLQMKEDFAKDPTKGAYELAPEVEQGPTFDGNNIIDYVDQTLLDNQGEIDGYTDSNVKQVVTVNQKPIIDENVEEEVKLLVNAIVFDENIDPDSKDYRDIVQQVYNSVMMPIIRKAAGNFDNFFDENIEKIFDPKLKVLPIQYLYQAERLSDVKNFAEFVKDLTTQAEIRKARDNREAFVENEAQGVTLYKRKKVSLDFLKEYFGYQAKGKDLTTTIRARRNVLLGVLGAEATFDANPSILALSDLNPNKQATVLRKIERVAGMKFSEIHPDFLQNIDVLSQQYGTLDLDAFYDKLTSMAKVFGDAETIKALKDSRGQVLELLVAVDLEARGFVVLNKQDLLKLSKGNTGVDVVFYNPANPTKILGMEVKTSIFDRLGSDNKFSGPNPLPGLFIDTGTKDKIIKETEKIKTDIIEPNLKKINKKILSESDGALKLDKFHNGERMLGENAVKKNGKIIKPAVKKKIGITSKSETIKGISTFTDFYIEKGKKNNVDMAYLYTLDYGLLNLGTNPAGFTNVPSIFDAANNIDVNLVYGWFGTSSTDTQVTITKRAYINVIRKGLKVKEGPSIQNVKFSETQVDLNKEINDMIERKKGIESYKMYSRAKGRMIGESFGKGNIFIPWSAEDFGGFIYAFAGKGKQGDADLKFFNDHVMRPYNAAMAKMNNERMRLMDDFNALKKDIKSVPKKLKNKIPGEPFTYSHAVRVWIWNNQGMDIPDLSAADKRAMIKTIESDSDLLNFARTLIKINKGDGYPKPGNSWLAGNIKTDLYESLNKEKRSKHLEEWQQNVDIIFSETNKNKMRAAYGNNFVENLEGILERMKTGRNRKPGGNKMINGWLDWINGSVGAIMFVNMRSSILQTISMANYINWSDNNILAASKAFANQPQFWKDFMFIFNSDYLKERRGGLKLNVQESELAEAASKRGVRGVINLILKQGFLPTRIADSFAISSGGATFYRNRTKKYLKEGLSQKEAEAQAFQDFMEITETSQQSSRPDKISAQQASNMGRLLLAFANTPMQYNRLIKRAGQDLINGRGDWKTNVSKITYYSTIQNLLFNALQKAIFALGFGDDEVEDEVKKKKYIQVADGMLDSLLRGNGITGQIVMAAKNVIRDLVVQEKFNLVESLYDLSPPINSKISKLRSVEYIYKYGDKEEMQKINLRNPGLMAVAYTLSAIANIPLDRAIRKANNLESAMSEETELWQKIALILGWSEWELGVGPQAEKEKKKQNKTSDDIQNQIRERLNKKVEKLRQ